MHGSFNLCVPVTTPANRVLVRLPLPYRVGEYVRPGNSDEKVCCEAGTYAWLRRECPSVPIPHLYGCGLSKARHPHSSPKNRIIGGPRPGLSTANQPTAYHGATSLENENIPIDVNRSQTFPTVDSYVNAILSCHDSRLRHEQNAVNDFIDCVMQMSGLTTLRAVSQELFEQGLNSRPFIFQLTDMHASNILVDKNWNIEYIIDLGWAASQPFEFMQLPYWLTSQAVDVIDPEAYNALRQGFMQIFTEEEREISHARILGHHLEKGLNCSPIMNKCWESGTFWCILALRTPTGLHSIFYKHIQPIFEKGHFQDSNFFLMMHKYWSRDASDFPVQKITDREAYLDKLQEAFDPS
ncbi:hypothetical protein CPC735_061410 [Coccidioides posadasii C735 delta SOWgp]|uniref:Aminoglycoside phosphotransferase domain-containing protein n=1 Tax=Coccidioides posadasii (strain C735) TaxID=222929 RepID=C5P3K0_COCP7|nr:hypothetical protein CPC735_061410 [Coccidioides posadasii C735 delta SOWgp]EER28268.1 hypothetical protein CPC735_061410 [Coccidioides posadasii C735 delta SOWgp]|eukprot:XP_003070413.1 hypothetical protein CPC735_061410 [Coccidioides posadasii C735 delta SOWgp]